MNSFLKDWKAGIFKNPEPPCISLYQPMHRFHPGNQQDPIRFRNLTRELEQSLQQSYPSRDVQSLLNPFHALLEDRDFWVHALDGLAVLASPGMFRVYNLHRPVRELAVVADTFHLKPLLRIFQSADRYQVLALDRQQIKLFEGNRDVLDERELDPAVPRTAVQVVGKEEGKESHLSVWASPAQGGVHYGTASTAEESLENEAKRFFREVDRTLLQHHSRPSGSPLVLAALPENQSTFRQISHNPFLLPEGVNTHPDALTVEALRERAWEVFKPHYLARLEGIIEMFGRARSRELGTDDVEQTATNAIAGRVGTLLVEADRIIPGRILPSGDIERQDLGDAKVDDLLDDLAEVVLNNSGQVVVVPADRMPTKTGVAAIYRF